MGSPESAEVTWLIYARPHAAANVRCGSPAYATAILKPQYWLTYVLLVYAGPESSRLNPGIRDTGHKIGILGICCRKGSSCADTGIVDVLLPGESRAGPELSFR